MTIKRILVPTDFSRDADAALHYALELARQVGASVDLLHVVENPMAAVTWSLPADTADRAAQQVDLVREAKNRLRQAVPRLTGRRFGVGREVLVGPTAATIVRYAQEGLADLIVMGASGRTGVPRFSLGGVATRVTQTAPCPVLTLRASPREIEPQRRIA
jgi:nucleotide-binding universal stress UspA family protein